MKTLCLLFCNYHEKSDHLYSDFRVAYQSNGQHQRPCLAVERTQQQVMCKTVSILLLNGTFQYINTLRRRGRFKACSTWHSLTVFVWYPGMSLRPCRSSAKAILVYLRPGMPVYLGPTRWWERRKRKSVTTQRPSFNSFCVRPVAEV